MTIREISDRDGLKTDELDRLDELDQFRGFAILLMVLADYLSRIQRVPPWLKHASGSGLTVVDLIGPLFILAIGLTYKPSYQRRLDRDGSRKTILHFIRRFLALRLDHAAGDRASLLDQVGYKRHPAGQLPVPFGSGLDGTGDRYLILV
jgi:uncharacterized membrane protein